MDRTEGAIEETAGVFSFLGSEIRLRILESLYDRAVAAGPMDGSASYSEIREDVGVADSGRFSYHLDKLVGRFVSKSDGGYRLRESGRTVVRLRRTGILSEDPMVEPEPVDATCYRCGATVQAGYDNGHLLTQCPECPGLFTRDLIPEGTLSAIAYPPSGIDGVDIDVAFDRAHRLFNQRVAAMGAAFCPDCGGDVTATFEPCADHQPEPGGADVAVEEPCDRCGLSHPAFVRLSCGTCGQPRLTHPLHASHEREPVAGILRRLDCDSAWERLAELMRWSTTIGDGEVVFETSEGERLAVPTGRDRIVVERR